MAPMPFPALESLAEAATPTSSVSKSAMPQSWKVAAPNSPNTQQTPNHVRLHQGSRGGSPLLYSRTPKSALPSSLLLPSPHFHPFPATLPNTPAYSAEDKKDKYTAAQYSSDISRAESERTAEVGTRSETGESKKEASNPRRTGRCLAATTSPKRERCADPVERRDRGGGGGAPNQTECHID